MLKELTLKPVYSTEYDDLLQDFYLPVLTEAKSYDRAVGFFSARMLSLAAQGVSALVERHGSMRLVVGAALPPEEDLAIRDGYLRRELIERLGQGFAKVIDDVADGLARNRLETLSWLVSAGRLDIMVAVRRQGMFHDKLGIVTDPVGDQVVFQGSANETPHAMLPDFNFESINVFVSWQEALREHLQAHRDRFERLWANTVPNTVVIPFPEVSTEKLMAVQKMASYPSIRVELDIWKQLSGVVEEERQSYEPSIPVTIGSRPFKVLEHQQRALQNWKVSDFSGVLEHATGAGKTVTAIYGATRLFEQVGRLLLIVAVPYQNLADQWIRELERFRWSAVACYRTKTRWEEKLRDKLSMFEAGVVDAMCVVVVNRTLGSETFQEMVRGLDSRQVMFVGDECHHFGAERSSAALPSVARYRLGLSATPWDETSSSRTGRVRGYFGEIVDRFTLREALDKGVLTPYTYEVIVCRLGEEEAEEYLDLSRQIARLIVDEQEETSPILGALLNRRARVLAHCEDKLDRLKRLVAGEKVSSLSLFYCGDGTVEGEDLGPSMRHVHAVTSLLHDAGWKSSAFTAQESLGERRRILANFELGLIDSVVAIRCLDEGIDVPACRSAFMLASSRNSRQFIQRRGRILRRAPGKEVARVVDFAVLLPAGWGEQTERRLFQSELRRMVEFAKTSRNVGEVYESVEELLDEYDLGHEFVAGMI